MFRKYDPGSLLLGQAERELLRQELDVAQLAAALRRMQGQQLAAVRLARPSPLAFPLLVERFREKLSNESLADRIARLVADLEGRAGGSAGEEAKLVFARESLQEAARESVASDRDEARPKRRTRRTRIRP